MPKKSPRQLKSKKMSLIVGGLAILAIAGIVLYNNFGATPQIFEAGVDELDELAAAAGADEDTASRVPFPDNFSYTWNFENEADLGNPKTGWRTIRFTDPKLDSGEFLGSITKKGQGSPYLFITRANEYFLFKSDKQYSYTLTVELSVDKTLNSTTDSTAEETDPALTNEEPVTVRVSAGRTVKADRRHRRRTISIYRVEQTMATNSGKQTLVFELPATAKRASWLNLQPYVNYRWDKANPSVTDIRIESIKLERKYSPSFNPAPINEACGGVHNIACVRKAQCIFEDGSPTSPYAEASGNCRAL